jgi:NAD(P)H-dependent FMN reductase
MPIPLARLAPAGAQVLIVASSLSEGSRSQQLARIAAAKLAAADIAVTHLDMTAHPLPFAGTGAAWSDPAVDRIQKVTTAATHLLFAIPIYNYDTNAVAKNFIELMGEDALGGKTVGFLCSAGGQGSYMAVLSFANSLMLDFRCWIVPRFLYVTQDLTDGRLPEALDERLDGLLGDLLTRGLGGE